MATKYQSAIQIPILFELALTPVTLDNPFANELADFHDKVAKYFPVTSLELQRQKTADGTQAMLYNSIQRAIDILDEENPKQFEWVKRGSYKITDAGIRRVQRRFAATIPMEMAECTDLWTRLMPVLRGYFDIGEGSIEIHELFTRIEALKCDQFKSMLSKAPDRFRAIIAGSVRQEFAFS